MAKELAAKNPQEQNAKQLHTCAHCGRILTCLSKLKLHLRSHTGERPFACNLCPRAFANISYLRRHQEELHSGQRYKCRLCRRTFARPSYVEIHERTHVRAKPFQCDLCPRDFGSFHTLVEHKRLKHNGVGCKPKKRAATAFRSRVSQTNSTDAKPGLTVPSKPVKPVRTQLPSATLDGAIKSALSCKVKASNADRPVVTAGVGSVEVMEKKKSSSGPANLVKEVPGSVVQGKLRSARTHVVAVAEPAASFQDPVTDDNTLRQHKQEMHSSEKPYKCCLCRLAFSQPWYAEIHERTHAHAKYLSPLDPSGCNDTLAFQLNGSGCKAETQFSTGFKTQANNQTSATSKFRLAVPSGPIKPVSSQSPSATTSDKVFKWSTGRALPVVQGTSLVTRTPTIVKTELAAADNTLQWRQEEIHSGQQYKCRYCRHAFSRPWYVEIHERTHGIRAKPLPCDLWTRDFGHNYTSSTPKGLSVKNCVMDNNSVVRARGLTWQSPQQGVAKQTAAQTESINVKSRLAVPVEPPVSKSNETIKTNVTSIKRTISSNSKAVEVQVSKTRRTAKSAVAAVVDFTKVKEIGDLSAKAEDSSEETLAQSSRTVGFKSAIGRTRLAAKAGPVSSVQKGHPTARHSKAVTAAFVRDNPSSATSDNAKKAALRSSVKQTAASLNADKANTSKAPKALRSVAVPLIPEFCADVVQVEDESLAAFSVKDAVEKDLSHCRRSARKIFKSSAGPVKLLNDGPDALVQRKSRPAKTRAEVKPLSAETFDEVVMAKPASDEPTVEAEAMSPEASAAVEEINETTTAECVPEDALPQPSQSNSTVPESSAMVEAVGDGSPEVDMIVDDDVSLPSRSNSPEEPVDGEEIEGGSSDITMIDDTADDELPLPSPSMSAGISADMCGNTESNADFQMKKESLGSVTCYKGNSASKVLEKPAIMDRVIKHTKSFEFCLHQKRLLKLPPERAIVEKRANLAKIGDRLLGAARPLDSKFEKPRMLEFNLFLPRVHTQVAKYYRPFADVAISPAGQDDALANVEISDESTDDDADSDADNSEFSHRSHSSHSTWSLDSDEAFLTTLRLDSGNSTTFPDHRSRQPRPESETAYFIGFAERFAAKGRATRLQSQPAVRRRKATSYYGSEGGTGKFNEEVHRLETEAIEERRGLDWHNLPHPDDFDPDFDDDVFTDDPNHPQLLKEPLQLHCGRPYRLRYGCSLDEFGQMFQDPEVRRRVKEDQAQFWEDYRLERNLPEEDEEEEEQEEASFRTDSELDSEEDSQFSGSEEGEGNASDYSSVEAEEIEAPSSEGEHGSSFEL